MKILVSFSGGKDSQACLIYACKEFGADAIEAVFCDTLWEHADTYRHIVEVTKLLGVKLITLRADIGGFEALCKQMKWFPDAQRRMCTVRLKIKPMIDYVLTIDDNVLIIQGIRASESATRSKLPCSANYFQDYFIENHKNTLYRKGDVRKWCEKHLATVERPMFGLSAQEVIDYILENGQQPNPLYRKGFSRVGCYPCIYARLSDLRAMKNDTFYTERLISLENEINELRSQFSPASFFPKGKIPSRFCLKYGNNIPSFEDVLQYVSRDDNQLELFDEQESSSCMSIYHGLCE